MEISISGMALHCRPRKCRPTQLLRVMKLTASIIIVACMHVSAHSYSQNITFSGKDVPLQSVFASIEKQTGLSFFFNYALIKDIKPVTLEVKDAPLEDALHQVLKGKELDFYRTGKTIFIVKMREKQVATVPLGSDGPTVLEGRIVGENGIPLEGATILVKKLNKQAFTNGKGEFQIKGLPSGEYEVEVSYVGYQSYYSRVNVSSEAVRIVIELKQASNDLDQTVVKGYYNTTKRFNTGDVTTIKAEDIEKQPVNNPLLALEGRVPGMVITQSNGLPGGSIKVQIRGRNTIAQGTDPLYVIDGMPYSSTIFAPGGNYGLGSGILGGTGINPFSFISPAEIESIEILKDADATAIYGSRGANGVVLITTKKGKIGVTKISVNVQSGIGRVSKKADLMNTQQYLGMRKEAFKNDSITPNLSNAPDLLKYDQNAYTDWQKVMIGGTENYTDAQTSISGGTINNQYRIGAGYHRETTVFPGNWNDQKASVSFNQNISSSNQRLKTSLSGSFISDNNHLPNQDFTNYILIAPNAPSLQNPDGSLNWTDYPNGNPFAIKNFRYNAKTNNLLANSIIGYSILPGLEIKANLGYNNIQLNENTAALSTFSNPAYNITSGSASFNRNSLIFWSLEPQVNYQISFGQGILSALAGYSIQRRETNGQAINGSGYTNDALLGSLAAASTITKGVSSDEQYKYNSIFARVGYNWADKYLLNLTARRDGSSRFGPGKQFGNFGAIGAAWIFSNEGFMKGALPVISYGKLRGSYGTTGNEPSQNYQYLELYSFYSGYNPYGGGIGIYPTKLPSPGFAWEVNKKMEIGVEIGLIKDRINLTANYYISKTSNQLVSYQLPQIVGFSGVVANLPATIQNRSSELILNTINIKGKAFSWSSSFNITIPQNKLVAFPNIENTTYKNTLIIGQPVSSTRLFRYAGVDPTSGIYQFYDKNGKLTVSPILGVDNTQLLNISPKYFGGLQNSFSFHNFQLDILLQYIKQIGVNGNFSNANPGYFSTGSSSNQLVNVLDRWQKPGDIAQFQKFTTNYPPSFDLAAASTAAYSDASFLRIKNVSLSYNFSKTYLKGLKISNLQLFIHAQNLFVFTHYKGSDPESQNIATLPPLRVFTGGIQLIL